MPRKLTAEQRRRIAEQYAAGFSVGYLMREYGATSPQIRNSVRAHGAWRNPQDEQIEMPDGDGDEADLALDTTLLDLAFQVREVGFTNRRGVYYPPWSADEECRRRGAALPGEYEPPTIDDRKLSHGGPGDI